MFDLGAPVELIIHACEFSIVVGRGVLGLFGIRCQDPQPTENRQGALPLYWRQDGVLHVPRVVAGLVGFPLCLLAAGLVIWGVIEWVTS
jgi:hypothetical protein